MVRRNAATGPRPPALLDVSLGSPLGRQANGSVFSARCGDTRCGDTRCRGPVLPGGTARTERRSACQRAKSSSLAGPRLWRATTCALVVLLVRAELAWAEQPAAPQQTDQPHAGQLPWEQSQAKQLPAEPPQTEPPQGALWEPEEALSPEELETELDTIVVVGRASGPGGSAQRGLLVGSRDLTTRLELQDEHPDDTYELFSKTPGVTMARYGQGIINTDVAIRGFAGDGTTPHAKLLIDGVPSHLHNGYGELDQLFPLAIGSIEVFKGTSDVRYGRFNTAGNYYVTSRTDEATELQATYGSFNSFEAQAYSGLELGPLTQNLFAGYRQTNGFRQHSEIQKYSASGRWALELNDSGSLAFMARLSGYEGDSPGYLSAENARPARRSSSAFANQDGGEKEVQHLSLHFDHEFFADTLRLSAKLYRQAFERTRWVRFSEEGSLQERFDDQTQAGLVSTLEWLPHADWSLTIGFDVQDEAVLEQRFGTMGQVRLRDTGNVIRNFDYDLRSYGGFGSVEFRPFERVAVSVGLRADALGGSFRSTDAEGNATYADIVDYGLIVQPKTNLSVALVGELVVFGNYGRSFQSPFGSSLYAVPDASRSPEVSLNDGWEVGAKYGSAAGLEVRLSYWQQNASREFVSLDGVDQSVGETSRSGVEAALSWHPVRPLLLWGNFSWNDSEISNPGDAATETAGNRLRSIPEFTTSFGARFDPTDYLFFAAHFDGQGSYFVNELNEGGRFGDYLLANAEAGLENDQHRLQLQVSNVFDSYLEYVFDFSADGTNTIHSPGAGMNANVSYVHTF